MQIELGQDPATGVPEVRIRTPAKLNLFLEILGKRPDGYHDIDTLMCPISLCDEVRVRIHPSPAITMAVNLPETVGVPSALDSLNNDPAFDIPTDGANLAVRAAQLVQETLGTVQGCHIQLNKRIPAAAGLGGGSSDAAAVTVACLCLWDRWDRQLANGVCAQLGSDIPFFLGDTQHIGLARARGRGELCNLLYDQPNLEFVVSHPPEGFSTKAVYAGFSRLAKPRNAEKIISSCQSGQTQKIGAELFNALQFSASNSSMWVNRQLELFRECGLKFMQMTGSGSSCFALLDSSSDDSQSIERIRSRAGRRGIPRVYSVTAWYAQAIEQQLRNETS